MIRINIPADAAPGEDSLCYLRANISYETEVHNIYSPKFSDTEISNDSEVSRISIDNEDKMNAKNDPLFDAHSIEEIKIYSYIDNVTEQDKLGSMQFMPSPKDSNLPQLVP